MKKTKNYAMPYPEQDDYFNVEDFQDMMVSVDDLMKKLSDSGAQISSDAEHLYNQTKAQMDNIQKRMNAFTALKEGSTTGDAELTDIRVAYDGREYGNAGEAVREQASDIHKALFGAGASIWSKAKSESTKYVAETKGICILNERFTAAGVVAKISRGTFAQNESTLNLDRECSAYIVEFEKNPGTVYMPSAETIKIVSTTKIIFEANGNARCWIPVEKGQYLAIDSTATAYTCESNHVPYMLYDQANKTLEYRGFGSTGSIEPVDLYSLALEYKLEYDMDDTGLVKQINANREAAASLKEDIGEQTFYQKQNNDSNIINGINGVGSITADKDCVIITSNKNLAIVTNSFSTDIQYGSPIQIDRRNIKAGKRYYVSFDTENTGCQCLTCFDNKNVKKFTCDGTRKQFDILCSEHNSNKKSPLIQVAVGGVQSGLFTNVQIEEEKFTSYVEHKGEEINLNANIIKNFFIYAGYTSVWCSDDSANIEITYQVNGVHYIDEKVANIVSKLDYIDGKVANIVSKFPNLKGKKVVTYGDSLFASGNDTNDYSWQKIVCESLGIENHIGVSIGGSGFCWNPNRRYTYPSNFVLGDNLPVGCFISSNGKRNANFCSWDRISKTIPKDADIVIVGTGTNDIGSFSTDLTFRTTNIQDTDWIASGEYSKYGGDFNTGGVRGAIMSTIMKIHCQAPNADIYLTNWCNSRGDNGTNNQTNTSRETETMAMLEDMEYASKNAGVPLFDLFHNSGINPLNRSDYVIDIIHLNTKGYKKMGNAIACAIKSLIN